MKKVLRIVLPLMVLVSAVVSCSREGRVIPVRKMERIYREMLLADQWLAENPDKRGIADTTWFYEPIFEKYGFVWGGRWYHYDTMHFEYRPELFESID